MNEKKIGDVVLDLKNISLSFGGVKALTDISFDVREHEVRAIIGPNGAGKSSMLNVINGVYTPQQGEHRLPRRSSFQQMNPRKAAEMGIARTFQNIALFKGMSVLDNIMTGRNLKMTPACICADAPARPAPSARRCAHREQVEQIIDFLEIQSYRKTPVGGCPTACRSASTSAARSRWSRRCCCSTSRWPA